MDGGTNGFQTRFSSLQINKGDSRKDCVFQKLPDKQTTRSSHKQKTLPRRNMNKKGKDILHTHQSPRKASRRDMFWI